MRLIFFDLDGTLVDGFEYIYQHLWDYFGVEREQTKAVLKQYLRGEISYEDWVKNDVRLLQEAGAKRQTIIKAIGTLRPMKGAESTIATLKKHGFKVFVLSGGIDLVIDAVFGEKAASLFDGIFINKYHFDKKGALVEATPTPYDMEHKATCIKDMAHRYNVPISSCYFVGDNENDVEAALCAGVSIAFNCKSDTLAQAAAHHVESNNLSDILPYILS